MPFGAWKHSERSRHIDSIYYYFKQLHYPYKILKYSKYTEVLFMANLLTTLKVLISVLALSRMADTEIVLSTNGRRAQTTLLAGNTEQDHITVLSHF